ncbi:hypothetical protein CC1G_08182 [Coprinopsis cinerea okayama7|uniref:Secreted protein n=1 Tax=Coprinopsis cinerea (strain Okayama-7 / 130 / ATCC MYA-4618 / FGSC 9003) TaxID=240176 RepID=A8P794_COPC7|nr:hypothetical protein CC1G_08182 [Coprinopsis cinerea okayama7\|eukprot:XP_001839315.1 hypothetical protein CC1G_08182 [Coprinopsis cinerea okayama7\
MLVSSLVFAALSLLQGVHGAAVAAEPEPEILTIDLGEKIASMNMTAFEESIALEYGESENTLEKRAEVVTCYNVGTKIDRKYAIMAINDFCNVVMGKYYSNNQEFAIRYTFGNEVPQSFLTSLKPINNCGGFTVDHNCGRLLRLPVDQCNTGGENGKQGGYMTDPCGTWRSDPGRWQSDCPWCRNQFYRDLSRPCSVLPPIAAETCYATAMINARQACIDNGQCCLGSGLGPEHNNCNTGPNDY